YRRAGRADRTGVQGPRRPEPGQALLADRRLNIRRDVRVRPHRTRWPIPADRLPPHEAPRRRRTRHPGTTRALGLLPTHPRPPERRSTGAHENLTRLHSTRRHLSGITAPDTTRLRPIAPRSSFPVSNPDIFSSLRHQAITEDRHQASNSASSL